MRCRLQMAHPLFPIDFFPNSALPLLPYSSCFTIHHISCSSTDSLNFANPYALCSPTFVHVQTGAFPTHSINLSYLCQKRHPPQTQASTRTLCTATRHDSNVAFSFIQCVDRLHLSKGPCLGLKAITFYVSIHGCVQTF